MTLSNAIKVLDLNVICSPQATEFKEAVQCIKTYLEKQNIETIMMSEINNKVQALNEHLNSNNGFAKNEALAALDIIQQQQAEIMRLNGCVKTEDEVKEIMESQMKSTMTKIIDEQVDLAMKAGIIRASTAALESLKNTIRTDLACGVDSSEYLENTIFKIIDDIETSVVAAAESVNEDK